MTRLFSVGDWVDSSDDDDYGFGKILYHHFLKPITLLIMN